MSDLTNWVRDICVQYGHRIVAGLLIVFASVAFGIAQAGEAQLNWTNPTQNTDASAIPATCPTGQTQCGRLSITRLEYGTCSGTAFGTRVGEITVAQPATTARVSDLVPRVYCFRAFARNDYTAESSASNVATKTIAAPVPQPPVLRVVDPVAYRLDAGSHNRVAFTAIGSVPVGTACMTSYSVTVSGNTMHMVTRTAATPVGSLPYQVWAKCSEV